MEANLGCATTRDLLYELEVRFTVSQKMRPAAQMWYLRNALDSELLDCRMVDSH